MTTKKNKRGPPPKGSRSTPQRTSPAFVTPMPAQVVKRLPEGGGWVYELKFDGYRALIINQSSPSGRRLTTWAALASSSGWSWAPVERPMCYLD